MPKIESFATAAAGLAIVVGLFLVCMWLLRRSGPRPTSPLPSDAVTVLGRLPLAARNFAHLLQVGNKLVLVAITPDGVAPITEVTDPAEVQRLLGLCLRNQKQSTTAEFHDVLQQLAKEPAEGFLGNEASATYASPTRS
jgi:flagellar biogenesis protein FliO